MKLGLRSFESKEALRIEVPNSCTLSQLRRILSETLPNSPSTAWIRLSLNRKDDLQSDGEDGLQSLGVAAGDLIFFSVEQPVADMSSNPQIAHFPVADSTPKLVSNDSECSTSINSQNDLSVNCDSVMLDSMKRETLDTRPRMEETADDMELDNSFNDDGLSEEVIDKSLSVPDFLRKVFAEELGDDAGRHHKLIVIAVHAVMLESEFVSFDEKANKVVDGLGFRDEWPSALFALSLSYTLPESISGADRVKSVVLKFQSLGKFMNVYGTLGGGQGKRSAHSVQLNEDQLVPFPNVVWANCGTIDILTGKDGEVLGTSPEKEVFKFWRAVKDNLALPLLIDFCEESGLELPCFMRLPTELKLKIFESLPGVDVAKVSGVCSEFRYLASADDLWKLKFTEEFSNEEKEAQLSWKKAFSMAWSRRNGRKLASRVRFVPFWPEQYWTHSRRRRHPNPFMVPRSRVPPIIGGDHDILPPPFDNDLPTRGLNDSINRPMRNFSPRCNLWVHGGRFV